MAMSANKISLDHQLGMVAQDIYDHINAPNYKTIVIHQTPWNANE